LRFNRIACPRPKPAASLRAPFLWRLTHFNGAPETLKIQKAEIEKA
jgi:hypothetical protein